MEFPKEAWHLFGLGLELDGAEAARVGKEVKELQLQVL